MRLKPPPRKRSTEKSSEADSGQRLSASFNTREQNVTKGSWSYSMDDDSDWPLEEEEERRDIGKPIVMEVKVFCLVMMGSLLLEEEEMKELDSSYYGEAPL